MNLPNASQSFKTLNPRLFGQPEAKNDSSAIVERKRGIPEGRKMNDTEAKFALRLEGMKRVGEIDGWMYESIRLRLADRTTYTPDFYSWIRWSIGNPEDGWENGYFRLCFYEIKGFRRDDAMVKFKVAREQYPWAEFQMWSLTKEGWKQVM